jgi:hypothetical protein
MWSKSHCLVIVEIRYREFLALAFSSGRQSYVRANKHFGNDYGGSSV